MQADERLAIRSEELRRINRAFWVMQQDFEQIVQRNVRDVSGGGSGSANGSSGTVPNWLVVDEKKPWPLQLTRGGRTNPLGLPRSDMQRVAYAVDRHPDYEKEGSAYYHDETLFLLRYSMADAGRQRRQGAGAGASVIAGYQQHSCFGAEQSGIDGKVATGRGELDRCESNGIACRSATRAMGRNTALVSGFLSAQFVKGR